MNKKITEFTFDEYKEYLSPYPIFDEIEVIVTETDDGYKIKVGDKDICEYNDDSGNKKVEDMSCNVMTMYTDKEGIINFIEHGFGAFTTANKNLVIHTAHFIGKRITDLEQHISKKN